MRPVGAEETEKGEVVEIIIIIIIFNNNYQKLFDCVIRNIMLLVFTA